MPYSKQTWEDHNLSYPLSAARMNHIEAGISAGSQLNSAGAGFTNVVEYGAKGDGTTDDTAAFKAALSAGKEGVVFVPPAKYRIKESLTVPIGTDLVGADCRTTIIEAEGNIKLLAPEGQNLISELFLKCASEQASGAAIDCEAGKPDNLWIERVQLGSNFFNGINLVANSGEFGGVHLNQIHFAEFNGAVKGYKGSGIVIGSSAVRAVAVWVDDVHIQVESTAGMLRGVRVNNADSLHLSRILCQNAKKGLTIGDTDASSKRTTNFGVNKFQADGCEEGFNVQNVRESANFMACQAEACTTGVVLLAEASTTTWQGGAFYHNTGHGMVVPGSVSPAYSNVFNGCQFIDNGEGKAAEAAGVNIEEKAGGLLFNGCVFGNPLLGGGGEQKYGIVLGKESENIGLYGCRFVKNGTAPFKQNGGEKAINNKTGTEAERKAAIEASNLMT